MFTTTTTSTDFRPGSTAPFRTAQRGVGVVACGYWGPNLLRSFHQNRDCRLLGLADLNQDRLAWAQGQCPHAEGLRPIRRFAAATQSLFLKGQPIPL